MTEDLDWAGIADPKTTNIFYMARHTGKALAGRLMQGRSQPPARVFFEVLAMILVLMLM